jgi:hypothetical protein
MSAVTPASGSQVVLTVLPLGLVVPVRIVRGGGA